MQYCHWIDLSILNCERSNKKIWTVECVKFFIPIPKDEKLDTVNNDMIVDETVKYYNMQTSTVWMYDSFLFWLFSRNSNNPKDTWHFHIDYTKIVLCRPMLFLIYVDLYYILYVLFQKISPSFR